jgi:hypothetical protein
VTPVLLFHPFVIGTVEAAYWAGWRFNPAKGAYIFDAASREPWSLERPLTAAQRKSYEELVAAARKSAEETEAVPDWKTLAHGAQPRLDGQGRPFLEVPLEGEQVPVGLCRGNALRISGSPEVVQELALTRLEFELKSKKPARISEREVKRDWQLLQDAREEQEAVLNEAQ